MKPWLLSVVLAATTTVGADEAVYVLRGPVAPSAHAVNGYVLDVRNGEDSAVVVHVETSLMPVGARGSYADVVASDPPDVPAGFELPPDLRHKLRPELGAWEAATEVLAWVSSNLALIDRDLRPQDAVSVLGRHGGRCSGLANATAALLMAAKPAAPVTDIIQAMTETAEHPSGEERRPDNRWGYGLIRPVEALKALN